MCGEEGSSLSFSLCMCKRKKRSTIKVEIEWDYVSDKGIERKWEGETAKAEKLCRERVLKR